MKCLNWLQSISYMKLLMSLLNNYLFRLVFIKSTKCTFIIWYDHD
jgi:hypothetical protein